jgi:23S rRNA (cytidine1920-2'-O)/16S rRNA (cytidine1409-2'-O)-methyltransferase
MEAGVLAWFALDAQLAAMLPDNPVRNRKPQSGSLAGPLARVERIEEVLARSFGDTRPVVLDGYPQARGGRRACRFSARHFRGADDDFLVIVVPLVFLVQGVARVGKQVHEHLLDLLDAALDHFGISVAARRALDVGASTGGFTDVLLHRGAESVTALDVGYGQLVWRLRTDPRVTVVDRTNFRTADIAALDAPFDVIVVDVSFISVGLLAAQLRAAGGPGTDYVVLVKPQFEVGREQVGGGGIVTDPALRGGAIRSVAAALADEGLGPLGVCRSPIEGSKGNVEFFLHLAHGAAGALDPDSIREVIET